MDAPMLINIVQNASLICEHYRETHPSDKCGGIPEVVNYFNSQNHQGNPYSKNYYPSWKNHPNLS